MEKKTVRRLDLVKLMGKETGAKQSVCDAILSQFIAVLHQQVLVEGKKLSLDGIGVFDSRHKQARQGRNPATGELAVIKPRDRLRFVPSAKYKVGCYK